MFSIANVLCWNLVILAGISFVSVIISVAILAPQSPYATDYYFLNYKHEKVKTIVFQVVVSPSHPSISCPCCPHRNAQGHSMLLAGVQEGSATCWLLCL